MGGLFGDLPPPSVPETSRGAEIPQGVMGSNPVGQTGWSTVGRQLIAPPTLMKPLFAPPSALRKPAVSGTARTARAAPPPPTSVTENAEEHSDRERGIVATGRSEAAVHASLSIANSSLGNAIIQASPLAVEAGSHNVYPGDGVSASIRTDGAALVAATVMDEYDPARPNEYEEILRERRRKKAEEEMMREMERRRREEEEREAERERELQRQREIQMAMQAEKERAAASLAAAEAVAASIGGADGNQRSISSGEEAWRRRGMLGMARPGAAVPPGLPLGSSSTEDSRNPGPERPGSDWDAGAGLRRSPTPPRAEEGGGGFSMPGIASGGLTAAERMMMKMGWKAGQGLGKQEQGITTPLMARKTDRRAGVIVNAPEKKSKGTPQPGVQGTQQQAGGDDAGAKPKGRLVLADSEPTHVVLLQNMVGPGEVDEELEEEVAGECLKYGAVTRVLIFEVTEAGFPASEAVRIFVAFERVESAVKAAVDLDGRFFGGRTVRASYFSELRFEQKDLAPSADEAPAGQK